MRTSILLFALLLSSLLVSAQRTRPAGQHEADKAEAQFEKSVPPPARQPQTTDLAKLRQNADELANLAQSIPPDVDQTTKGILPKELDQKLRRIEKLAKQLRSEINH
jgi:phage terminase Nu1 subunit (DNA packaging protein)